MKNKGFSMVELVVVIAIMVVLLAILVPSVVRYTEDSRMQRDESAMDEVCNAAQLALADSNTFDEVFGYAIPNNYITYTDSSGVYGAKYTDEEFWAPDGSGAGVTITFNPDENGTYYLADGIVNDMTFGNGSVASARVNDDIQQCYLEEMGKNSLLYNNLKKVVGETISEKSATYKNSSYTMFITYDLVNGVYRPDIYGSFNGTNLSEASPASLGSGTESYTPENEAVTTIPGGTTTPNYTSSDLSGGGTAGGGPTTWNNPYSPPGLTGGGTFNKATDTEPLVFTRTGTIKPIQEIKVNGNAIDTTSYSLENVTILKLSVDYLKTLAVGDYTIEVITEAGSASAQFEIKNMLPDTDTIIYNINNLDPGIRYTEVYATEAKMTWLYGTLPDNLIIPVAYKRGSTWYKVIAIGSQGFYECTNLSSVTIPDSATFIGEDAFRGCTNLSSVTIGNSVTSINDYAFGSCTNLTAVTIPDSVISIGNNAFKSCTSLTSATIGSSVTSIGFSAFESCTSLTSVSIPDGVVDIDYMAFYGCSSLTSIELPDSLTTIAYSTFGNCTNLTAVTIPDSVISIGSNAFTSCTKLTSIAIPNSVTTIGGGAFSACIRLASVTIGNSVTSIGNSAFKNCNSLASITVPDSVTSIGNDAFAYCYQLTSITIPDSVISIGDLAFYKCKKLTSITIPDSVTSIGSSAFSDCTSLTSATIGNCVTSISIGAFNGCTSLTSIVIPDSVISIGSSAFKSCTSLTSATIGNSVTSIGNFAFYYCENLTSIIIPDSVTSIGEYAFRGCDNLKRATFENTEGWWYASSSTATEGTSINCNDLSDPTTAATYLSKTYKYYSSHLRRS